MYGDLDAALMLATHLFVDGEMLSAWAWAAIIDDAREHIFLQLGKFAQSLMQRIETLLGEENIPSLEKEIVRIRREALSRLDWLEDKK
jgi:hypothetical protein